MGKEWVQDPRSLSICMLDEVFLSKIKSERCSSVELD